jgi:hypothetical protein
MMNMKTHPTAINDVTSFEDLGRQIGRLRYDLMQKVLVGMLQEIRTQQVNDETEGKVKLAYRLNELGDGLENANTAADEVIRICKPHIDAEKAYLDTLPGRKQYEKRQIMWNVEGS